MAENDNVSPQDQFDEETERMRQRGRDDEPIHAPFDENALLDPTIPKSLDPLDWKNDQQYKENEERRLHEKRIRGVFHLDNQDREVKEMLDSLPPLPDEDSYNIPDIESLMPPYELNVDYDIPDEDEDCLDY